MFLEMIELALEWVLHNLLVFLTWNLLMMS